MRWLPNLTKSAGHDTTPGVDSPVSTPPLSDVDTYTQWVEDGVELSDVLAQQDAVIASNPDTVRLRRERAYAASSAMIDADHRHRMDTLREADEQRQHDLSARRRHRRLETAAVDGEIDYRMTERDEARDRRRQIMSARAAHDPAIAAAEMTRDGARYVTTYTRISLAGAALAAVGLGAAAMTAGLPLPLAIAAGALGEVVLTLLITQIIGGRAALHARSTLARDHEGTVLAVPVPQWAARLPWYGVGLLLTASIVINVHGALTGADGAQILGALGALGAAIAALATGLAWGYSVETSATVGTLLSDHGIQAGMAEIDAIASGSRLHDLYTAHTPADAPAPSAPSREDVLAALAADPTLMDAALADAVDTAIEQMTDTSSCLPLADEDESETDSLEAGAVATVDRPLETGARVSAQTGAANRERVSDAWAALTDETGQAPTAADVARRVGLSERTVRRHLTVLGHLGQ